MVYNTYLTFMRICLRLVSKRTSVKQVSFRTLEFKLHVCLLKNGNSNVFYVVTADIKLSHFPSDETQWYLIFGLLYTVQVIFKNFYKLSPVTCSVQRFTSILQRRLLFSLRYQGCIIYKSLFLKQFYLNHVEFPSCVSNLVDEEILWYFGGI